MFGTPPRIPGIQCAFHAAIKAFIAKVTTSKVVHKTQNFTTASVILVSLLACYLLILIDVHLVTKKKPCMGEGSGGDALGMSFLVAVLEQPLA